MFENNVLRKIFEPNREETTEDGKYCIVKRFMAIRVLAIVGSNAAQTTDVCPGLFVLRCPVYAEA
jgi:hypothetical protein